jgi:drug/metabolite transporter (DMT)-like permease
MNGATAGTDKNGFQANAWHFAALLGGNAALALGPWLVRLADTGPVSAGFWRLFLPIPLIALLAWRGRTPGRFDRRLALVVMAAGVAFALDIASWHIGIERTRLGNATLFGNAGSLILMIWGLVALRRAPSSREWLGVFAALAGAAILLGRSLEISTLNLVRALDNGACSCWFALLHLPSFWALR